LKKILIIEDDPAVVEGLKESLKNEHFDVISSVSGEKGYQLAKTENVDLIILDLILPDIDGTDICRRLRNDNIYTPVVMLTGRKEDIDKIIGLEIGADDYVTKPFNPRELITRIKVILRRIDDYKSEDIRNYKFANIEVDFKKMEIIKNGKPFPLSVMELKVLKYMIEKKGEVVLRDDLLNNVWGYDSFPTTRTVDNHILSLRKKIEDYPPKPKYILTVHKAGYKFVDPGNE
jgi:DNA-binding response OmpR family regulator